MLTNNQTLSEGQPVLVSGGHYAAQRAAQVSFLPNGLNNGMVQQAVADLFPIPISNRSITRRRSSTPVRQHSTGHQTAHLTPVNRRNENGTNPEGLLENAEAEQTVSGVQLVCSIRTGLLLSKRPAAFV